MSNMGLMGSRFLRSQCLPMLELEIFEYAMMACLRAKRCPMMGSWELIERKIASSVLPPLTRDLSRYFIICDSRCETWDETRGLLARNWWWHNCTRRESRKPDGGCIMGCAEIRRPRNDHRALDDGGLRMKLLCCCPLCCRGRRMLWLSWR